MTNIPLPTLTATGFSAPAEADILTGVLADFKAAFGGNLNIDPSTPQGQLATSLTALIGAYNDLLLLFSNQVDPAYSDGRMQDAIGRIYYLSRLPAEPTSVVCTVTGLQGVTILVGALASDTSGNIYASTQSGTFGSSGTMSLTFANIVTGPIACPAGTLHSIYKTILGWDTITNAADGVIGRNVESRVAFEQRRAASIAVNASGSLGAIKGAVLQVPNVLGAYVTENTASTSQTIGGVTVAANSVYVCVAGGSASAIAQAIWSKKAPGCAYTGGTSVTVTDTNNGYQMPYPSYTVQFDVASPLTILHAVSIANSSAVPSDAVLQIDAAIQSVYAGTDGGIPPQIGATLYANRFYAAIAALGSWAQIVSLQIGTSTANAASVAVNINKIPVTSAGSIAVSFV